MTRNPDWNFMVGVVHKGCSHILLIILTHLPHLSSLICKWLPLTQLQMFMPSIIAVCIQLCDKACFE